MNAKSVLPSMLWVPRLRTRPEKSRIASRGACRASQTAGMQLFDRGVEGDVESVAGDRRPTKEERLHGQDLLPLDALVLGVDPAPACDLSNVDPVRAR